MGFDKLVDRVETAVTAARVAVRPAAPSAFHRSLATAIILAIALTLLFAASLGKGVPLAQASVENTPATGLPTISGTAQVGETLTADTSDIVDTDGLTNVSYSYQWLADGAEIAGATGLTYALADDDAGKAIRVRVSFTDDAGNAETLTSTATVAVALPALTQAQTVVRGPYLQSGTPSSVIIKWRTGEATDSVVRYGLDHDPDGLTQSATNSTSTTEHAVQLTGLSPGVKYFYSVGSSSALQLAGGDSDHFFVTAPVPGTAKPTRIWVIGDSGTADANARAVRNAFLEFTGSRDPDLWVMLGTTPITTEPTMITGRRSSIPTRRCCPRRCSGRPSETMTPTQPTPPPKVVPITTSFRSLATAKPAESPQGRKPITPSTTGICTSFA